MTGKPEKPVEPTAEASDHDLRDRIAIAAMTGLLGTHRDGGWRKGSLEILALGSYRLADLMLDARAGKINVPALKAGVFPRKDGED
jgi:hypothetical protein